MYAIQVSTTYTFSEISQVFEEKLPFTEVKFSHTNGPATNVLVSIKGKEDNRELAVTLQGLLEKTLYKYAGSFALVEIE